MSVTRVAATTLPTDEELAQRGAELRRLIVKAALRKALQTRNLLLVLLLTVNSMVAGVGRYRRAAATRALGLCPSAAPAPPGLWRCNVAVMGAGGGRCAAGLA
jgi:hypothetical protein